MAVIVSVLLAGQVAQADPSALSRAAALEAARQHSEALIIYLDEDRATPGKAKILCGIARQYDSLGKLASSVEEKRAFALKGVDAAERAVKADSANSAAHLCLAVAYGRQALGESSRRQMELSRLIKQEAEHSTRLDPANDMAWHVLGRWNFEMASVNPVLRGLAGAIYGKFPEASPERAVECFEKAIAAGPPRIMHHVEFGLILAKMDRKNDARKQLEIGLTLPAKDPEDEETQQRARQALADLH